MAAHRDGDATHALRSLRQVEQLLAGHGIGVRDYDAATSAFYDITVGPAGSPPTVIKPALVKGDKVLLRGVAEVGR